MKYLLFLIFSLSLFSDSISGTGYGSTIKEAKKEALGDLSSNIGGEVSSSFQSSKLINGYGVKAEKSHDISVESSYPILKPKFSTPKKEDGKYKVIANIDSRFSSRIYQDEMKNIKKEIFQGLKNANKRKGEIREKILKNVIQKFNKFQKYSVVARTINIKNIPFLNISKADIEAKLVDIIFFEQNNFISTEKLKVQIKTSKKSNKFKLYESLKLYIKLSKAGYYYIVNHSINKNGVSYSYLIEFNPDENDNKRFIRKIEAHQVGKWILVANIQISEPLGKEYIEVFAGQRFFTKLPKNKFDMNYNHFKLNGNSIFQNIRKSRGMIIEEKLSTAIYKFETSK